MKITVSKRKLSDPAPCFVEGTAEERLALVWPLTVEVVSMSEKYDPEQRLQRHIVRIIRRATGRTKDLADAEMLEDMIRPPV